MFPRLQNIDGASRLKRRTAYARYRLNLWLKRAGHVGHPASAIFRLRGRYGKPVEGGRNSFDFAAFAQPAGFRDGISVGRSTVVTKRLRRQADGRRSEALPPRPDCAPADAGSGG